jgi:uncharacterized protein (TIGR00369 family)
VSAPVMTREEVEAFLDREFPQLHFGGRVYSVEEIGPSSARMRLQAGDQHLRPGSTVSGPTLMALVDYTLYVAILGAVGPVALAVTINLNVNFMRKPQPGLLVCDARLMKIGRRLAVGEASVRREGEADVLCHATGTYSLPTDRF